MVSMPFCINKAIILMLLSQLPSPTESRVDILQDNIDKMFFNKKTISNNTNILLILADDLGYGDTSVQPFIGSQILTPELEKMAQRGTIMSNFHTAAATCTPTRASVLTGLYPWRMGIKAVFEYGEKGKSNRDDWLPHMLTSAMVFRDSQYFTGHSGKWHVGGMRNDDLDMRLLPPKGDSRGKRRCAHPGPNQQGFEDYVSVLDGPGSPRQNELQVPSALYSQGCNYLLRNDEAIGTQGASDKQEYLSDCEARHAIRMMTESVKAGKPFYIHLWFHAPHGPWEYIPGFDGMYTKAGFGTDSYKTMVSAMDKSIGDVLNAVRSLGIEKNTLVVFMSDNGPEDNHGATAGFRGRKRYLYEGGIRVPSIWQWVGTIPKGRTVHSFGASTDLFPTFLHAAGIPIPSNARLDGTSLLPDLIPSMKGRRHGRKGHADRVAMWHGDYEGPRSSAAWIYDFKLMFNQSDFPTELYDVKHDPYETHNYLAPYVNDSLTELLNYKAPPGSIDLSVFRSNRTQMATRDMRNNTVLHRLIVAKVYDLLRNFVLHGNEAYLIYMAKNHGRFYEPTVRSDTRKGHRKYKDVSNSEAKRQTNALLAGKCATLCSCDVPQGKQMEAFPFAQAQHLRRFAQPGEVPAAHTLLLS